MLHFIYKYFSTNMVSDERSFMMYKWPVTKFCREGPCKGIVGSFSNDDINGNKNVKKKTIGLITKTTILHVHCAFWYISMPSLLD